jgi:hypothetical protein
LKLIPRSIPSRSQAEQAGRDIRSKAWGDSGRMGRVNAPHARKQAERRSSIRRAPSNAGREGQILGEREGRALADAGLLLESDCSAQDEIILHRAEIRSERPFDLKGEVVRRIRGNQVPVRTESENRLQTMARVRELPTNVKR